MKGSGDCEKTGRSWDKLGDARKIFLSQYENVLSIMHKIKRIYLDIMPIYFEKYKEYNKAII